VWHARIASDKKTVETFAKMAGLIDARIANDHLGARGGLSAPTNLGSGRQAAAGTRALAAQDSITPFWAMQEANRSGERA
jgi:hypothetical protein